MATVYLEPATPFNPSDFPRTLKMTGLKGNYVRVDPERPVDAYMSNGTIKQWELEAVIPTREQAQELANQHMRVKVKTDGTYSMNLKRKTLTGKGTPSAHVKVVDSGDKAKNIAPQPFKDVNSIGNGSTLNINVYQFHYDMEGVKEGISDMLSAIQVTDLILYSGSGSSGFDIEDGFTQSEQSSTTTSKSSNELEVPF